MRKIFLTFAWLFFIFLPLLAFPSPARAEACGQNITINVVPEERVFTKDEPQTVEITVTVDDISLIDQSKKYYVLFGGAGDVDRLSETRTLVQGPNPFSITIPQTSNANWGITLKVDQLIHLFDTVCSDGNYIADNTSGANSTTGVSGSSGGMTPAGTPENTCDDPELQADTALGCIPTEPVELAKWVLKYGILMGGGIAFLLSIFGGATILMSAGNPEKINEGREIITAAISGLLFIVLSVFFLRLIGVDILGIPGFSAK